MHNEREHTNIQPGISRQAAYARPGLPLENNSSVKMEYENVQPKWIRFFDKDMYHHYENFVKTRDFSKILSRDAQRKPPSFRRGLTSHPADVSVCNPEAEYSEIPGDRNLPPVALHPQHPPAAEVRARKKRTRTYVILGVLVMSLVAMLVAVLLHFHVQKSLFGGTSHEESKTRFPHKIRKNSNRTGVPFSAAIRTGANVKTSITREMNTVDSKILQLRRNPGRIWNNDVITAPTSGQQLGSTLSSAALSLTTENEYVILNCIVRGIPTWQRIAVMRLNQSNPVHAHTIAEVRTDVKGDNTSPDPRVTTEYIRSGSDVIFLVKITRPACIDNGLYACVANITPKKVLTATCKLRLTITCPVKVPPGYRTVPLVLAKNV